MKIYFQKIALNCKHCVEGKKIILGLSVVSILSNVTENKLYSSNILK